MLLNKYPVILATALSVHLQAVHALGAYFCNDINWVTDCVHWKNLVSGQCYTLDAGHQDKVSSFGPDVGTGCFLAPDYSCVSDYGYLANPGSGDLRTVYYSPEPGVEVAVNDNMNSFWCTSV
ncbi:hypothetical protein C8F04DRAFT_1110163 [Mycena alexandri]|uniref:Uncharacterized protein n=1 Tax=Mycena alexandri TaxID=1745969 RepID=A0AAD6SQ89_9AGAR|nr:hypothetical protein C8F04DRAFT_1110163 [Mycena alexandri]